MPSFKDRMNARKIRRQWLERAKSGTDYQREMFDHAGVWETYAQRGSVVLPVIFSGEEAVNLIRGKEVLIDHMKLDFRPDEAFDLQLRDWMPPDPVIVQQVDPLKVEFIKDQLMASTDLLHAIYIETEEVPVDIYKAAQKLSRQMAKAAQLEERKGLHESDEDFFEFIDNTD